MLYTLTLHNDKCQLYLNKDGKNQVDKNKIKFIGKRCMAKGRE